MQDSVIEIFLQLGKLAKVFRGSSIGSKRIAGFKIPLGVFKVVQLLIMTPENEQKGRPVPFSCGRPILRLEAR